MTRLNLPIRGRVLLSLSTGRLNLDGGPSSSSRDCRGYDQPLRRAGMHLPFTVLLLSDFTDPWRLQCCSKSSNPFQRDATSPKAQPTHRLD